MHIRSSTYVVCDKEILSRLVRVAPFFFKHNEPMYVVLIYAYFAQCYADSYLKTFGVCVRKVCAYI